MQMKQLLEGLMEIPSPANVEVTGLALDSRKLAKGDVFFAMIGSQNDGRHYVPNAIAQGASAVVVEAAVDEAISFHEHVPIISLPGLSQHLGEIASRFYHHPAKSMQMLAVTGTNGKTSCTHFLAQLSDLPCAVIGTLGSGIYPNVQEGGLTTPDAITLQRLLADFAKQGSKRVAMEVSSHSIHQGRVNGIDYDVGVFTNLTQDHLDYHGSMQEYAAVKHSFISGSATRTVVVNADDEWGRSWLTELAREKPVYAFSHAMTAEARSQLKVPLVYAENLQLSLTGMHCDVFSPWGEGKLYAPLIGAFNLSNVLAVLTTMCLNGTPFAQVLDRITRLKPVPGRMQTLTRVNKPLVVVDYSHTPDALQKALQALRAHTVGKLICVFGCGGNRDAGKRPIMAAIAEQLADQVIVTNDNPRHESPEAIAKQIMGGFTRPERVEIQLDRSKAIANSIQYGTEQDCILVAGKGAESYQQIGDEKIHFDDVEEVERYFTASGT